MLSASEASTVDGEIERQGQVFGLRNQRNQKDHTATLARSRVIRGGKKKKKKSLLEGLRRLSSAVGLGVRALSSEAADSSPLAFRL